MIKNGWFAWTGFFSACFVLGLIGFSFLLHGTAGMLRVNGTLKTGYISLGSLGFFLLLLAWLENRLASQHKDRQTVLLSLMVRLITTVLLVVSLGVFSYIGDFFDRSPGIGTPRLLVAEGIQVSGVPNLAVVFQTTSVTNNTVTWGSGDTIFGIIAEQKSFKSHVFNLGSLKPEGTYWYQINDGDKIFFKTPCIGKNLRFAVSSDAHFGAGANPSQSTKDMLDLIADPAKNYQMFFSLGDFVEFGFRNGQWRTAFQCVSPLISKIPAVLVAGNHDNLYTGINNYTKYCYPEGLSLEGGTPLWHRIDNGNIHFLILDVEWSAETITPAQEAWLETQLASIPPQDWKIVMGHGFYYSSGYITQGWKWYDNPETISALTPLFEKYGVNIVFSGHNHQMEVLQKNGVTYVICGVFGGVMDPQRTYTSPASIWYSVAQHAFVEVEISGNNADINFRGNDGSALYSFTLTAKIN